MVRTRAVRCEPIKSLRLVLARVATQRMRLAQPPIGSARRDRNRHSNTAIATARHLAWTALRHICKTGSGDLDEVWQHDFGDDGIVDPLLISA